ncbi:phosphoglycolate phosphatase [Clostridium acetobutylicum]|uniref:Predicted phosphatase, HAD family n=1 Tax=Clostridium acetobutylicum (strain ATCC 824 / DSM 792 / JCM 1419 / IAM 19013 / LMG 5710 / NBRC 13948 / NRRL B-527 / VKM B-1787 / 2291 / W) TaxID=272562 RepID=Q97LY2_CLOAB|nr:MULTISPECIES: HAD family hydrolase [Clostridium]AAK78398.1 Predicted phosphatase, HAD family [Clostridium acetobutylicum ATCC 824]ADZ19467.1 phosphatase, HAD family [Clostridium acetobutylicum EA 2018]AEI33705.1 HAD family phosphatase [Clostridium acetobutylicum DSM 1731]AWV80121.1 HAD family hydrolase [Clostridium acetobutylicum]MBC2392300.1 HAD family hydrolase [Clostridium acetobutylicum]
MYNYVLFDLDGTLTDSAEGITKSVKYSLNKFDIQVEDLSSLNKFVGPPLKTSFMEYYNFDEETATVAIDYYRDYFKAKGMFENKVYDGIEALLSSLKDYGFHLVVATSKPTVFSKQILEHFKLAFYFDAIVGSSLDGKLSTKEDVIRYAMESLNIKSDDAIMIGDREYDVIGALKNNLPSIGVTYGFGSYEELKNAGANYIVNSVDELHKKILELR